VQRHLTLKEWGAFISILFGDVKTVCMHVYGLPVGASKHARSLDEIRTPCSQ
jgi:hypothetical protein